MEFHCLMFLRLRRQANRMQGWTWLRNKRAGYRARLSAASKLSGDAQRKKHQWLRSGRTPKMPLTARRGETSRAFQMRRSCRYINPDPMNGAMIASTNPSTAITPNKPARWRTSAARASVVSTTERWTDSCKPCTLDKTGRLLAKKS